MIDETEERSMKKLACIAVTMALAVAFAVPAFAQSSKAAWRFSELVDLSANSGGTTDTGWQTILTTHIKTPNAKELAIGVSLQCGLATSTTVRSKHGPQATSSPQGMLNVRPKLTQPDGTIIYAVPDNE